MDRRITTPLTETEISSLRTGEKVLLSGWILVGRDQVHKRLSEQLERNEPLPVDIRSQTIFYMGPSPAPEAMPIGSCGPTTSARMDRFSPLLLDNGLKGMIGKGPRNSEVINAIVRNRAVYFAAFGGCGALYASLVKRVRNLAYEELGPEALLAIEVEDFPLIVAIDSLGEDIYSQEPVS